MFRLLQEDLRRRWEAVVLACHREPVGARRLKARRDQRPRDRRRSFRTDAKQSELSQTGPTTSVKAGLLGISFFDRNDSVMAAIKRGLKRSPFIAASMTRKSLFYVLPIKDAREGFPRFRKLIFPAQAGFCNGPRVCFWGRNVLNQRAVFSDLGTFSFRR